MTIYMITMPWNASSKKMINLYLTRNDIHDWTIGYEVGRDGYRHIHVRLNSRDSFEDLQRSFMGNHIEQATTDDDWYERKDGHFISSKDTIDIRRCRFGKLRDNQQKVLKLLDRQSDRGCLVWFDNRGGCGKSFFCRYLVERGRAYYVPPTVENSKQIIQYVCAGYKGQPYIIIDIPRSAKWSQSLYTAIEAVKDGLVYDTRYTAKIRDIWGCKILVLTNSLPNLDALSKDRWTICNKDGLYASSKMLSIAVEKMKRVGNATCSQTDTEESTKIITCHKKNGGTYKRRIKSRRSSP